MLLPSSTGCNSQTEQVTVDNLDAFLVAVLRSMPECSKHQFPGLKKRTVDSIARAQPRSVSILSHFHFLRTVWQQPGLSEPKLAVPAGAYSAAAAYKQPAALYSKAKASGNNFGKVFYLALSIPVAGCRAQSQMI
jgi:hypothetical protein